MDDKSDKSEKIIFSSEKFGKITRLQVSDYFSNSGELQRISLKDADSISVYAICSGASACTSSYMVPCC